MKQRSKYKQVEALRSRYYRTSKTAVKRMLDKHTQKIIAAVKNAQTPEGMVDAVNSVNLDARVTHEAIESIYINVGAAFAKTTVEEIKGKKEKADADYYTAYMRRYVEQYTGKKVTTITNTTRDVAVRVVRNAVNEGLEKGYAIEKIADLIASHMRTYNAVRAVTIARTETIAASNAGSLQGAKATGMTLRKVWLATEDSKTRDAHRQMDGVKVGLNDTFRVPIIDNDGNVLGYDNLQHPAAPDGSAHNVINCRCTIIYERE